MEIFLLPPFQEFQIHNSNFVDIFIIKVIPIMYFYIVPWSSNSWKFQNDADADTLRIIVSMCIIDDNDTMK